MPIRRPSRLTSSHAACLIAITSLTGLAGAETRPVDQQLPAYQAQMVKVPKDARYILPDGSIRINGAEHVQSMLEQCNVLFAQTHAGFKFALELKGTSSAMPALTHDVTPFVAMGRAVNGVELVPYGKIVGQDPLEIRVAHDSNTSTKLATSLAVYVNSANPLEHLTMDQFARIFATDNPGGDFSRWGQVGLKGEWAKRAIHPYGTPEYSGFGDYMEKNHLAGLAYAPGTEELADGADILKHVSEDVGGIGYAAIGRAGPNLKMLTLAPKSSAAFSDGKLEDIVAGKYPLGRFLYFYIRRVPNQPVDPWVKEYFRLLLSKDGQAIIASEPDGYIPLTAAEAAAELAKLE
jgi:phosphate transport system substrate-binding protein